MKERNSRVNYEWGHDPVWRHTTYKHDMSDVSNINFKLVDESTRKFPKSLEIKRNPQLKQPHLSPELIREFQQQRIHPLKRMGGFALGYDPPDHLSTYTKGNLSYQWQKPRDQHELIETQNVSIADAIFTVTYCAIECCDSFLCHSYLTPHHTRT